MWKVYKRTCPNGRVYIGITSKTLDERMQNGYQNNREFALDIIKYGKENIISEVLEEHDNYEFALDREWYYIALYRDICYNKIGNSKGSLHKTPPAQNPLHRSPSTNTASAQRKQHIIPLTTKPTDRHICPISSYDLQGNYITTYENAKLAAKKTGINQGDIISCCKGIKSDGQPKYQCRGLIFRYAVDKLDEFPEKNYRCKRVNQYTLDGEYIHTFASLKDAWLHTGVAIGAIGTVCKGLGKSAGGYMWQYTE